MLYTSEDQQKEQQAFQPSAVNDLGPVTVTGSQKFVFWLIVALTLGIGYFVMGIKKINWLNAKQNKINELASGIDVQLQKRFDTLTKLVDSVKGQINFNKDIYENIAKFRSNYKENDLSDKAESLNQIQAGLTMAFENYPDLGADDSVRKLMNEATMIEKEIAASRRLYNAEVTQFNTAIYNFPTNVVVYKKGYRGMNLFKADESVKKDVELKF